MNKQRKIKFIVAGSLAAVAGLALTSCGGSKSSKSSTTTNYTVSFDVNDPDTTDSITLDAIEAVTVKKGATVTLTDLTYEGYTFGGWYTDSALTKKFTSTTAVESDLTLYAKWTKNAAATEKVTVTFNTNGGSSIVPVEVDKGSTVDEPTAPTLDGYTFDGWYTDEALTNAFSFATPITTTTTLYAKWVAEAAAGIDIPEGYELVQTEVTFDGKTYDATNGSTLGNVYLYKGAEKIDTGSTKKVTKYDGTEVTVPRFKMKGATTGVTVDSEGATVGTVLTDDVTKITDKAIKVNIPGINAQLDVAVAAAGTGGRSLVVLDSKGTVVYSVTTSASDMFTFSLTDLEGGDYYLVESNGYNFYYIGTKCAAEKADVASIKVTSAGTSKFFAGTEFNTTGLSVTALKSNGASQALTDAEITIDSSAVKMDTAGTYTVVIKYGSFETSYDVTVYDLEDMELGFNSMAKSATNTSAGNSQYVNTPVQQVYTVNDTIDFDGLTITGYAASNAYLQRFNEASSYVTTDAASVDMTTAGKKTINVTLTLNGVTKTESFDIYVVDTALATVTEDSVVTEANVYVDASYTGSLGAQVTYGTISKTCNTFTTIQQALDFLGEQEGIGTVRKNVYIAAGTYNEKIELTLPYLSLIGIAGADSTIIEYDSVFGIEDESGFAHVTDSTQTVAIRDTAVNCIIDGITISNYYNEITDFAGTAYEGNGERALALLCQADQVIVQNSKLLGWQDTLELFTGRQLFKNTYISGCVDYIFGTNNTTMFEGCEIHTVKSKTQYTDDSKVTAYLTAFKGCNKGDSDAITYGAIFNDCDFTTSDDFVGKVAVGRCWGAYSAVAILNSRLSDKISTSCSDTIVSMNAKNTDTTIQYWFYNNTLADGETAVTFTENISTVTNHVLTKDEADKYVDYSVVFGTANRGVTYNTTWNPSYTGVVVDTNVYYDFGAMSSTTGTVNTWTFAEAGAVDTEFEGLTIKTNKCKAFGQYTEVQAGTMSIDVEAGTTLSIKTGYSTNESLNINGIVSTTDTLTQYFETAQTVTINFTGKVYLLGIKVSTTEKAPDATTITSITASSAKSVFELNDTFETTGLVVKENYSDGTYKVLGTDDYTVDSSAVKMDTKGTYTVTVTAGTQTATYDVMVGVDTSISTDTVLKFNSVYAGDITNTVTWANNKVTGTQDGFTIAGSAYSNSGYLEFKSDDTITFDIAIPEGYSKAKIVISNYNDVASTVSVDGGDAITPTKTSDASHAIEYTYEVTTSGTVTIAAIANQQNYLNFVSIVFVA